MDAQTNCLTFILKKNLKTWQFSEKFYSYNWIFFMTSKQIYGCLFAVDIGHKDILKSVSHA